MKVVKGPTADKVKVLSGKLLRQFVGLRLPRVGSVMAGSPRRADGAAPGNVPSQFLNLLTLKGIEIVKRKSRGHSVRGFEE